MRVYHYLEAKWALSNISAGWLKLSTIDDMNDPYEWECVRSMDAPSQLVLERTKEGIVKLHRPLCFSRSWNNILMWSHYGDRHKGICLGFDITEATAMEVKYFQNLHIVGPLVDAPREDQKPTFALLYAGKYGGWCYEEEVRVYGEPDKEKEGKCFVSFSEHLRLREVIAGARFPKSSKPAFDDALKSYSGIKIVKTTRSTERFEIKRDEHGFDE
jgi:DUF2971 family protein